MKKEFLVKGSASDPYRVVFNKDGRNLSAYCTCPAEENGLYCKHRINILRGSTKNIVSGNPADVTDVVTWLGGTDVEACLDSVEKLESEAERIKSELTKAKKDLARAMRD